MTAPMPETMSPREKVELKPCPFCGGEAVAGSNFDNDHYVMCGADCDRCGGMVGYMKTEMAAIENWNRRTALASGSGDHAELARLAEAATPGPWMYGVHGGYTILGGPGTGAGCTDGVSYENEAEYGGWGWVFFSCDDGKTITEADGRFIAAANPATVLALLAEIAALRAESESARTVVAWANNSLFGSCGYFHGDPYDGLHLARPIEALKDRATEAERKLAEAVGLLEDAADELESEVEYRYSHVKDHPAMTPKYDRDMDTVRRIRTFLSKEAERG